MSSSPTELNLAAVANLYEQALVACNNGDLDRVRSHLAIADAHLAAKRPVRVDAGQLHDTLTLHDRLLTTLRAAQIATATELERLRQGRTALRAYGNRRGPAGDHGAV